MSDRELTTGKHSVCTRILLSPERAQQHINMLARTHPQYVLDNVFKSELLWTFAGRVEQSGLEGNHLHVQQVLVNGHLHGETSVGIHVGQRQKIRGTNKEVAMESVYRQA